MIIAPIRKSLFCKISFAGILMFLIGGMGISNAQTPAFPGAEGYGKYTSGGRGGTVYEVTNLNNSGPGSLRDAVSVSGRTVVFKVSGEIELLSQLVIMGNITVAGQTAPGDGICVRDYPTKIGGDNVIIRYIRFRLGDRYGLKSDALDINDRTNVILDHCTMSWGVDECFSAYNNHNVSIQWCIIGEGLNLAGHSMGGLWGGYTSYHHNLIHTNGTRHPKYAYTYDGDITDSRNNVIYNWGYNSAYTSPTGNVNLANNYYKAGPATEGGIKDRIVQGEPTKRMYVEGNYVAGYPAVTADNWIGVDPLNGGIPIRYDTPFTVPNPLPEQSAQEAYLEVIQHGGASFPIRDDADNRAIKNVLDSTGFILVRQSEAGGFPNLYSVEAPVDTDHDGMPDDYETGLGLNPGDDTDRNGDLNGNGYTNLEDYINGLISYEMQLPKPGFFKAQTVAEDTVYLCWYDLNDDELGFILERSVDSSLFTVVDTLAPNLTEYSDSGLAPLTKYYYRIRSYNDTIDSDLAHSEGVTTFAAGVLPEKVSLLSPADNSTDMPIGGVKLEWEAGENTLAFDVYIGDSPTSLELMEESTTSTSYSTGKLDYSSEVYWRIDAKNKLGTTESDVWKFTTVTAALPELLGYWPFEETGGNTVYDSSGYGNHGTMIDNANLFHTEGIFGKAIDFSDSDTTGYLEIPHQEHLALNDEPFSISLWMRFESTSTKSTYILFKGAHKAVSGTEQNGRWIGLEMRNSRVYFTIDDNSKKTDCATSTSAGFVTGEWVHVVLVRDIFQKKLFIYKNNVLSAEANDNTKGVTCNLPLMIGNSDFLIDTYHGELDELVICKHPLSLGEIDSLYRFNKIPTMEFIPPAVNGITTPIAQVGNLHVYPNPFKNNIAIEFDNGAQNNVLIEIYTTTGQLIRRMDKSVIPNTKNRLSWDGLSDNHSKVSKGVYLLLIKTKDGVVTGSTSLIKTE